MAHLLPGPGPEAACRAAGAAYYVSTYYVSTYAVVFAALISVCRCCSIRGPGRGVAACLACAAGAPRTACAFACLAGLAPPCQDHRWASSGLASVTVAFFAAAFLLVLAAYVSLARALQTPSGPGPASAGAHPRAAKTMVLGLLLVFALSLAPYHLLLAPRVAGRHSDGDRCRAASTLDNSAHLQPGAAEPQQLPGPTHLMLLRAPLPPGLLLGTELPPCEGGAQGARGLLGLLLESLLASPPVSPPCHPPSGIQGGESSLERPRF